MNVFKKLQADRYVRKLQSGSAPGEAIADAQSQLMALGPAAIRSIFESTRGKAPTGPALDVLERLLTNETLPAYVEALNSTEHTIVECAAVALSRGKNYDPTLLLPLFSDPKASKARLEAILSAQMKSLQPRTLLQVLPDLSRDARGSVFRLLEKRADSSIVGEAVRMAVHTEWWLRLHMVKLLSRFPGTETQQTVTQLLKDENPAVRLEAVKTLAQLKVVEAIPGLCSRLRDPDIKIQTAAIEALITIGDVRAVGYLVEYLKDESEYVRRGAVEVLNQVITVDAIKDLISALRDEDWWVRVRAADALGSLGGERVVDAVIALIDDPDDFMRRYVVEILNMVTDPRAVGTLIHALDDEDWWVRERAIDALAKIKDARAVDPLLRVLSRDQRAIPLCIKALGAIGDHRAVEPLCRLTSSANPDVRREAIHTLVKFAKAQMPADTRTTLMTTLEAVGADIGRSGAKPLEVRGQMGPETGRPATSPAKGSDVSTPASPASGSPSGGENMSGMVLDFQHLKTGAVLVDRFRVIERIGGGGFGTVYLVEDTVVREELVLKILSPHLSRDEMMIRRFVQELKLTRRITHLNVIRIHDLLDLNGGHAISMEYFRGRDLGRVLREQGRLPVDRALHIAEHVLNGLAAAHELGIVHRDIKPGNLLIGDGDLVKIVDFGLAAVGQTTRSRLTQSGILVGTPEYIAPELITGKEVDLRADLYSLGCVLYHALSGREPFTGESAVNILFQHLEPNVPPLNEVVPAIPQGVNDLVMRAMARFMNDRPQSALEMLEALAPLRRAA